ncbi:MAG: hypothetical protein ACTSPD_05695 [Promethearchaeota archaeon]
MTYKRINPRSLIKFYSKLGFFLNLLIIGFAIVYFLIPVYSTLYDIFGVILFLSWCVNIVLLYLIDKYIIKSSDIGKSLNQLSYFYIFLFIIGILDIIIQLFLLNVLYEILEFYQISLIICYAVISVSVLCIAIFGIYLSIQINTSLDIRGAWKF